MRTTSDEDLRRLIAWYQKNTNPSWTTRTVYEQTQRALAELANRRADEDRAPRAGAEVDAGDELPKLTERQAQVLYLVSVNRRDLVCPKQNAKVLEALVEAGAMDSWFRLTVTGVAVLKAAEVGRS